MTPLDRAALADALKDATPAMLREDAARHIGVANALDATRWPGHPGPNDQMAAWHRRAAALALAVATMQERGEARVEQDLMGGDYLCTDTPIQMVHRDGADTPIRIIDYGGCDLMPALAALLKGDQ